ncbi:MAG: hypothetical protein PVJ67_05845 [Candidatus Pacearchaeota archaeon]
MAKTLHGKVNKNYDSEIVSFQFREPVRMYKNRECLLVEVTEPKKNN